MSTLLSVDHLIVYTFLLITLVVGLWASRGIKDIREYAIGNKQFGTGVLTMTILATYIGGWHLAGLPSDVFADGLVHIIPDVLCGIVICLLFIARFVAPKIVYFRGCLTIGDLMKVFYGESGQIVTGCLGLIYNTAAISIQILFLAHFCTLFGIESEWGLSIATLMLTIYTAKGGMRAVAITDVLQFAAIIAAIPLLAHLVVYQAGGIQTLLSSIAQEKLQLFNLGQEKTGAFSKSYYSIIILILWMLFPGFPLSSPFIQRMLMAKNAQQSATMYYISIAFLVPFFLLLVLIGLAVLAIYPDIHSQEVMSHSINRLPVGLKGLMWMACLAVVMSTIDSFLHAAGVSLTHDLIKPLLKKKVAFFNELKVTRYTTLCIGCLAIIVVLMLKNVANIAMYGMDLAALLFTIPLVAGIMGLKTDARSFFISTITTVAVFVGSPWLINNEYVIPVAIAANALSFFGTHYLHNGGFAVVKRHTTPQTDSVWQPTWHRTGLNLMRWVPTTKKLLHYSRESVEKYGANPTVFALFISLSYMVPFFMHSYAEPALYNWLLAMRGVGALLCVGLLIKSQWPTRYLTYFPLYYHLSLLYCLPFMTTFLLLLEHGSAASIVNIALSIMFLVVLVDWLSFVLITLSGSSLALLICKLGVGQWVANSNMDIEKKYTLAYTIIFSTLIGLLFARRKQKSFDTLATKQAQLTVDHKEAQGELMEATAEKFRFVELLQKSGLEQLGSLAQLSKKLLAKSKQEGQTAHFINPLQQLTDQLVPMALHIDKISHRTTGFLILDKVEQLSIAQFLQVIYQKLHDRGHTLRTILRTQQTMMKCDPEKLQKVIVNGFSFMRSVGNEAQQPLVGIEDTKLGYAIDSVSPNHIKKVASLRFTITAADTLPEIEKLYMAQVSEVCTLKPEVPTDMPLVTNERIIKAHYGYSSTIRTGTELTLVYVIPVNVREVRSKDMDTPQMALGSTWPRADDTYPGAQEQELEFLKSVKTLTTVDEGLLYKALDLIKEYHGPRRRDTGEPFYLHPISVAQIVLEYNHEEATLLGALLHDAVEDTPLTLEQIDLMFGQEVRQIVAGLTHMESHKSTMYKVQLSRPENIHRLLESEDKRVLYVKLADRLHNMRTLQAKSPDSQRKTAEETLLFFVPLAKYLRLPEVASTLRDLSFAVLAQ